MPQRSYILISLDTVRADVAYSGKFEALNEFMVAGIVFRKVISCSPLTPVSHASILTGLYPIRHGIRHLFKEKLGDHVVTMAQYFQEAGYQTAGIVSCPGMNRWYGFHRGFDHYDDEIPLLPDGSDPLLSTDVAYRGLAAKRGADVIDRGLDWLRHHQDQPVFLFLHFFDAHWPYEAPEPFRTRHADNPYEGEVAYSDHQLKCLNDGLEHLKIADQFTWIICADHGEDLEGLYSNDHAGPKLGNPHERGHGSLLYDSTLRVPLILYNTQLEVGRKEIEAQVRTIDIMPTILDLAGLKPAQPLDGVSLLPYLTGKSDDLPAYSETFYPEEYTGPTPMGKDLRPLQSVRVVVEGKELSIIWSRGADDIEIYDLKNDPDQRHNLF